MAMPKVLDWLDELVAKVATNTANIAKNASDIAENKKLFDTHVADDERHWTTEDRNNFDRVVHFKGYFVSIEKLKEAYPTGQLGDYAIVGGTDTVWLWDDESNSWLNSTEQGIVISVNGRTGEVILTKTDVGLSNVDNTADKDKPISTAQQTALNAKADRKKITLAQADSLGLRAGIYYIDNESKKINDFTASYWTVIVAERSTGTNASATQIWMNYNSNSTQHIYMRKQQNGPSWSEFREILTDIHYSELDTKIQTNIEDIGDLQVNKANRGIITLEQANAITGLKSGIYSIEGASIKILDITDNYWTVVQGDWTDGGAVQIWIPFSTGQKTAMYWRHQTKDTDNTTRIWGEFSKVGTSSDISNLQSQITTNKNNITTNKNNITGLTTRVTNAEKDIDTNTSDISLLKQKTDTTNTNVSNLQSQVNTNATNIQTNADEIDKLKTKTDTTNANVASNTANIEKILEGSATVPSIEHAQEADNANKLGGQLPSYYAKASDLSKYLPLTGGTLTGKTTVLGTAASASFWVRGIMGCTENGASESALYLNYNNSQPVYINGTNLVYHSGNIPKASTTVQGIVQLNNTRTSTSTTQAATAAALKSAYDTVNGALTTHKNDTTVHLTTADRTILTKANKFKGYYETETALNNAHPTGEAGDYAIVNTTDTVWIWDADKEGGAGWKDGAGKGSVISVNNMTGEVVLTKSNIGLGNVDNTSDANKPISTAQQAALNLKVNKAGDTMTGTINSSKTTFSYLAGSQGSAVINSTASNGAYTTLIKSNSTNGKFTLNTFQSNLIIGYMSNTAIEAGTNSLTKSWYFAEDGTLRPRS